MNIPNLSVTINGIALSAPRVPRQSEVLTAETLSFICTLHGEFGTRAAALGQREDDVGTNPVIEASWRSLIGQHLGDPAPTIVRPRCLGRREVRMFRQGQPLSAGLVDFGIHVHRNARALLAEGRAPFVELPPTHREEEVELWQDIFTRAEQLLEIPAGTIRAIHLNPRGAAQSRAVTHAAGVAAGPHPARAAA